MPTPRVKFSAQEVSAAAATALVRELNVHVGARAKLFGTAGIDDSDASRVVLNMAFASQTEADTLFQLLAARLGQTHGPSGTVSFHLCSHAAGEPSSQWTSCAAAPSFKQAT